MRPRAALVAVGIGLLASLPMSAALVDHADAQAAVLYFSNLVCARYLRVSPNISEFIARRS